MDGVNNKCKDLPSSDIDDVHVITENCCNVNDESSVDVDSNEIEGTGEMNDKLDIYEEPSEEEQNTHISSSTCAGTVANAAENQHGPLPHERESISRNNLLGKETHEQGEEGPSEQYEVVDKMIEKTVVDKLLPKRDTCTKVLKPLEYVQASDKMRNSSESIPNDEEEDPLQAVKYSSDFLEDILEEPKDRLDILEEPKDKLDIMEGPKDKIDILEDNLEEPKDKLDIVEEPKDNLDILEDNLKVPKDKLDIVEEPKDKLDILDSSLVKPKDKLDILDSSLVEPKGKLDILEWRKLSEKIHQTKSEVKGIHFFMTCFRFLCIIAVHCLDLRLSLLAYEPLSSVEVYVYAVGFRGPTVLQPDLPADEQTLSVPDLPGYNVTAAENITITRNPTEASRMEVPPVERAVDHIREGHDQNRTEEPRMCLMSGVVMDGTTSQVEGTILFRQGRNDSVLPEDDGETKQMRLTLQNILTVEEQYRNQSPNTGTQYQNENDRVLNEEIMGRQATLMADGRQSSSHPTLSDIQGREECPGDNTRHDAESRLSSGLFSVLPGEPQEMLEHRARANTFRYNWPHCYLSGEQMAHAGLYFTGYEDKTRCPFCGICIDRWEEGDDPVEEHRELSQECTFAFTRWQVATPRNQVNKGHVVRQKRDGSGNKVAGGQPDLDGATANCAAEGILMHKIEEKESDDAGNKNRHNNKGRCPYAEAMERRGSKIQRQNGMYLNPELNSMTGNEERSGAHQLGETDESSRDAATGERARSLRQAISSDQTTREIAWQVEPGGAQSTVRAQRNVLDEESQRLAGMIGNEERAGSHQLGRTDASSRNAATRERARSHRQGINSDQTTQERAWQEEPGGAQSTERAQRNVLEEESQGMIGMIGDEERAGSHQLGRTDASSRNPATRERARSLRQAISSDQTTREIAWQEEPGGAQSTERAQRNVLEEELQGMSGTYSLSDRVEQFLHSSDGRQLLSEGYARQYIEYAITAYLFCRSIGGDSPIRMDTVRLALQSLSARPKRKDKEEDR